MEGRKDYEKQRTLLFKGTKYTTAIFLPIVIIIIIFARPLITYWMGKGFEESILTAQVLIAWWLFNSLLNPAGGMLTAKGHARALFKIYVLNAISNLILSLILVRYYGILGVALGTTLGMVLVNFPLLLAKALRVLEIPLKEYCEVTIIENLGAYILAFVLPFLSLRFYYPDNLFTTLIEMGITYLIAVIGGFIIFFPVEERKEILEILKVRSF
jgi:O-antigen/teichoic acid export membrane protein